MPKSTAGVSSERTTYNTADIEQFLKGKAINMSEEDKKTFSSIMQRFERMRTARTAIDRDWQIAQAQFEANFIPYSDGRSRSNVPLEWAIVELFVSESLNRDFTEKVSAIGESDVGKVEVMRRVMEYVKSKGKIKEELYKNDYITGIFGTGYYFPAYVQDSRVINDISYGADGGETYVKKLLKNNKIIIKALDPRYVFLDDRTNDFNDDVDQVYISYITPEALLNLKYDSCYKNIDSVSIGMRENMVFYTREEQGKMNDGVVELMHYFNKQADRYVVIANRQMVIRDTPLPYSHKELPIVPRQYAYNPLSKYGRGLCSALLSFKSNINNLNEMIMDGIFRSNNSKFIIAGGLTFDGENYGFDNTILHANGPVGPESFQEIRGQAPNQAIFSYATDLLRQIAIYIGIDPAAIIGESASTAFETAVKQETGLKRVNVALQNRDIALTRVYERHLANVMQFFPLKLARGLLEIQDGKIKGEPTYPSILLKNEKYDEESGEIVQTEGNFPFEVKPEYIRGQFDISIETNFNAPSLKQLKLERYKDFFSAVGSLVDVMQVPELKDKIPFEELIEDMAFDFDIDLNAIGGMEGGIKKQKEALMKQVSQLVGIPEEQSGTEPPAPPAPTPGAGGEPPEGVRKVVGGVGIPNTPDINNVNPAVKAII